MTPSPFGIRGVFAPSQRPRDLYGCWKYVPGGVRKYSAIAVFLINSEADWLPACPLLISPFTVNSPPGAEKDWTGAGGTGDRGKLPRETARGQAWRQEERLEKLLTRLGQLPLLAGPCPPCLSSTTIFSKEEREHRFPARSRLPPLTGGGLCAR